MPDETPNEGSPDNQPASQEPPQEPSVTPGGYSYTVVNDDGESTPGPAASAPAPSGGVRVHPLALIAAVVIPAVIAGVIVWLLAGSGSSDKDRVSADVSNVVNAFSQGQDGTVSKRYEGTLPPGYPSEVPGYPGATIVSSVLQLTGEDAGYLVVYDTKDSRQEVADEFQQKLSADPWQIEAAQDGRDSTVFQFSKIDDANIRGLVLAAESKDDELTTIVVSVQVTSGATDQQQEAFTPGDSKPLPEGFPDAVPQYPGSTVIESAYQKQSGGNSYVVSLVTTDDVSQVTDYYREQLQSGGLTVQDGDATQSSLENAAVVEFTDSGETVGGQMTAGTFAEDDSYTRIDLQVQVRT